MLDNQGFTRFDAEVFQSVLEQMIAFGGYPNAYIEIENSNTAAKITISHSKSL
jgi:hypothetical protein